MLMLKAEFCKEKTDFAELRLLLEYFRLSLFHDWL